jgi:hypothetical protein
VSARALDITSMGAFIWACSPRALDKMMFEIEGELIAYLARYTGFDIESMDRQRVSRLARIANGISRILKEENGK